MGKLALYRACPILGAGLGKDRLFDPGPLRMNKTIEFVIWLLVCCALCASAAGPKHNWDLHCAQCHGTDGKGKTKMGEKLGVKDLTDPALQAKVSDEDMVKTIKNGVRSGGMTRMKAYGDVLTDEEIRQLVKLIRSFKK